MEKAITDVHVGNPCAFGTWKLIWTDTEQQVHTAPISKKVAMTLIASGMPQEG